MATKPARFTRRAARTIAGATLALLLGATTMAGDEAAIDLVDRVTRAAAGEEAIDADGLLDAYRVVMGRWVADAHAMDVDVMRFVEAVHATRERLGGAGHRFAELDWRIHSFRLAQVGRLSELERFVSVVAPAYGSTTPYAALLWIDLAGIQRELGELDEAAASMDRAADVLDAIGDSDDPRVADPLARARCLLAGSRAFEMIERGLADLAHPFVEECVDQGERLLHDRDDPSLYLDALLVRIAHAMALDRFEEVVRWVDDEEAREVMQRPASAAQRSKILLRVGMSQVFLERFDPDRPVEARRTLESIEAEIDAGGDLVERRLLRVWTAIAAMHEGRLDEARAAIAAAAALVDPEQVDFDPHFATVQALRARLARQTGAGMAELRSELERIDDVLDRTIESWRARAVTATGQGFLLFDEVNDVVAETVALLVAVHGRERGAEEAWNRLLRVQSVGSLARSLGGGAPTLDEVRARFCGARRGCLLVVPGWNGSYALLLDAMHAGCFDLPPSFELARARRDVVAAASGVVRGDAGRNEASLAPILVRASAAFLPGAVASGIDAWDGITVVATDGTGYLPFELLPFRDGVTLGERFAIDYLPSMPVGLVLLDRAGARSVVRAADAMGVVMVGLDDDGSDGLAFGAEERRLLLDAWSVRDPLVVRARDTGVAALEDVTVAGADWLQIIAHGARDERSVRPFGLRLGRDRLTPERAERVAMPPVVVVTACETWRGPMRRGDDGRDHLAGALFLAGADLLVMSHAPVDHHDALRATNVFHRAVAEGHSPAEAMRRARELARRRSGGRIPVNASLIHVLGLGHEPIFASSPLAAGDDAAPRRWWIGALAAAAVVGVGWRVSRRRRNQSLV